jgi:hypothetical protein
MTAQTRPPSFDEYLDAPDTSRAQTSMGFSTPSMFLASSLGGQILISTISAAINRGCFARDCAETIEYYPLISGLSRSIVPTIDAR